MATKKPKNTARTRVGGLTPLQSKFVKEFLADEDMRVSVAYQRAARCSARVAQVNGSRMLRSASVKAAIAKGMEERQKRVNIAHDDIIRRLWGIVTADTNELIEHRRDCCRHCYGKKFEFQWIDKDEWERAVAAETAQAADDKRQPQLPDNAGGYGFDQHKLPNEDCPRCGGEGKPYVHIHDSRLLSGGARLLYEGVEQTQHGIKLKMADKGAAMEKLMRHLGMFNDKLTLKGDAENPLQLLLSSLPGAIVTPVKQSDE